MKTKTQHTPGPWRSGKQGPQNEWTRFGVWSLDGSCIAACESSVASNEANARLIAAAPEMFELLSEGVQRARDARNVEFIEELLAWAQDAKEIILKAEGR